MYFHSYDLPFFAGKANGEAVAVSEEAAKEPEEAAKEDGEGEKSDKEKIAAEEEGEKKEEEAPAEEKEAETESKEPEEPKAEEPAKVSAMAKICNLCTASVAKVGNFVEELQILQKFGANT